MGGRRREGAASPDAWVLEVPGDQLGRALGRLPGWRRCVGAALWPHPPALQEGPWGPLLLTTQALLCGGGVPREERKPDKEREQQIWDG